MQESYKPSRWWVWVPDNRGHLKLGEILDSWDAACDWLRRWYMVRNLSHLFNSSPQSLNSEYCLSTHIVTGDSAPQLTITVTDEPGAGGANHDYHIDWMDHSNNTQPNSLDIHFQEGPIKEHGVNGVTQEALLAIVIDRLRFFQAGPFPSPLNYSALRNCEEALDNLQERTRDRIKRGVEGQTKA